MTLHRHSAHIESEDDANDDADKDVGRFSY